MENIIQQIALDLVEKITKKAFEAKISDMVDCIIKLNNKIKNP